MEQVATIYSMSNRSRWHGCSRSFQMCLAKSGWKKDYICIPKERTTLQLDIKDRTLENMANNQD